MGYGDSDEATVINSNTKTAYFVKEFNVANPSLYDNVTLDLMYDDGAVVYLNGVEIDRVNMPVGTVDYNTFASGNSGENALYNNSYINTLVAGTNILAIEVHQQSATSSDISFDASLVGNIAGLTSIIRGPYLQKGTEDGVTIKWRTADPTVSVLHYGSSTTALNDTIKDLNPKTDHEITLTGLNPATVYYYEIANSSFILKAADPELYFKTHPVIGSTDPVRAWILGDCGTANNNQRNVRNAYYNYAGTDHTDLMLFLGDNAYNDGTDTQYQYAIFENMYEDQMQNTIAWSCLGNHDGHSTNGATQTGPYYDIFTFPVNGESGGTASGTEAYYSFDYGNVHFIVLDSYQTSRSVGGSMYNWCESDLQNTTANWIVALFHHPPYTKGSHNSDTEGNLIDMRQNFLPLLESYGADIVLSGHSHSYERSYLLTEHYGFSSSFDAALNTYGDRGYTDGREDQSGHYEKWRQGDDAGKGAVYLTAGSSGKITGNGALNHPAMYYSVKQLGSCVMDVHEDTLRMKFLRETGVVEDYFTIIKDECDYGAMCDDLDPCTINDTLDLNCMCVGEYTDDDNDGLCIADDCDDNDAMVAGPGSACDDNDACTINDVYDANCLCAGSFVDTDGDGVCDVDDCDPADPNVFTVGAPCDDGIACTFNDITTANCECVGVLNDADGDNVCTPDDCDDNDAAVAGAGSSCDDNDPCTVSDVYDANCNCAGTFYDTDGDGVCNNDDCNVIDPNVNTIGATCDDGDPCTINDITSAACVCVGTYVDADGDGVCAADDCDDNDPAIGAVGDSCDDNDVCTVSDVLDANCNCVGTFYDSDGDGICNNDDCNVIDPNVHTVGASCDDGDPCTVNDVTTATCQCVGTLMDADGDGICTMDDCDDTDPLAGGAGTACDDGDPCTINDVYDNSCNCAGTFEDSDNDGVCNADDCDPFDPAILINTGPCDDGDPCTINDAYDANCDCVGTYTDNDGDGVCVALDCDDNDASASSTDVCGICGGSGQTFTNFPTSSIFTTGTTTVSSTMNFTTPQTGVNFTIYGIENNLGGSVADRYIEEVTILYDDENGNTMLYGVFSNVPSIQVIINNTVQSVTAILQDGENGDSGSSQMKIFFTTAVSCPVSDPCLVYMYRGNVIPDDVYEVSDSIVSDGMVPNGGSVYFKGNLISLEAGFEVEQNATFEATIEPCP